MTPDYQHQAEEAARYVLGQLSPAARHAFEVQLAQSPELRLLVQELEEGVEAMARTVPQHRPPPGTWAAIEKEINQDVQRKIVRPLWSNWWKNGWFAAAACFLALLTYISWPRESTGPLAVAPTEPASETLIENSAQEVRVVLPENHASIASTVEPTYAPPVVEPTAELIRLRREVGALRSQLNDISAMVVQQRAIMAEPGRFKFFPPSLANSGENSEVSTVTPQLQRAIFYAMARDMGWMPKANPSPTERFNAAQPIVSTEWGIDFVTFDKSSSSSATSSTMAAMDSNNQATMESAEAATIAPLSVRPTGDGIPGYLKKDIQPELVLAFDPSIISPGSIVAFWSASAVEGHRLIGNVVVGENPMVVTLPTERIAEHLTVTANPIAGPSNIIGGFQIYRGVQLNSVLPQSP